MSADIPGADDLNEGGFLPGLTPEEEAVLRGDLGNGAYGEYALFAEAASEGDWKKDAAKQEHHRTQRFRDHFDRMVVGTMWVIVVGFWLLAIIWGINLIAGSHAWLDKDQMYNLQGLLTGGLLLGLLTKHIERRVEDRQPAT